MKYQITSSLIITLFCVAFFACDAPPPAKSMGEKVFRAKCTRCHGLDGRKGKKGAKDLNLSTKSIEFRINQIKKGKDKMPSFATRLNEEQINAVALYTIEAFGLKQDTINIK